MKAAARYMFILSSEHLLTGLIQLEAVKNVCFALELIVFSIGNGV